MPKAKTPTIVPTKMISTAAAIVRLQRRFAEGCFGTGADGATLVFSPWFMVNQRIANTPPYQFAHLLPGEARCVNRQPHFGEWFLVKDSSWIEDGCAKEPWRPAFTIWECGFSWQQLEAFARQHKALEADERLTDAYRGVSIRTDAELHPTKRAVERLEKQVMKLLPEDFSGPCEVTRDVELALSFDANVTALEIVEYLCANAARRRVA